jgi:hypothetical protein
MPSTAQVPSIASMGMRSRNSNPKAITDSSSSGRFTLASTRQLHVEPEGRDLHRLPEQQVQREPQRQIGNHAHHRRGDGSQRSRECVLAAQTLDMGRPGENPTKHGRKVTQVVSRAPRVAAHSEGSAPA